MAAEGRIGGDAASERPSTGPRPLTRAAWAISAIVLGLVALSALARTGDLVGTVLADFSRGYGRLGLAITGGSLLAGGGLVLASRRAGERRWLRGVGLPLLIVALAVAIRVALAVMADAPLRGENAIVHEQALAVLDGQCCFSHRPLGYPITLAAAYGLLGVGSASVEALNIGFAAVTAWLVWEIGRITWGRGVAAMAATAYAVVPSQVLMTLVPLTEPMYTMLVTAAVRAGIALERRPMLAAAAAGAALLAAGQYVRATAASLLAPMAALPWLVGWPAGRTLARAALMGGVLVVLLAPVVAYNLGTHGALSLSTSAYGGWSLYVGANREHGGQWNADDAARLDGFPGSSWWERSEYAGSLAMDRVLEDPLGSLALLPRKFSTVWGDETYAATYALRTPALTREVRVGWLTSQLFWAPMVVLAALGMLATRRDPPPAALLIGMIVTLVALTHLALEVHSRYHAYLVPLFCLLAALGAEALVGRWRADRPGLTAG